MINQDTGVCLPHRSKSKTRRTQREFTEHNAMPLITGLEDHG